MWNRQSIAGDISIVDSSLQGFFVSLPERAQFEIFGFYDDHI